MPVLEKKPAVSTQLDTSRNFEGTKRGSLLRACANPACRSGWLHVWRGRQTPVFEGGWACSRECMGMLLRAAVMRELDGREAAPVAHAHRVPLGLELLSQGAITQPQLRNALEQQRQEPGARLGELLMTHCGVAEQRITRALSTQWSCPVMTLDHHSPALMAALVPRLFVDAFNVLPLRVAGNRILYLAFEDRIDRCLTLGVERMSGLQVEAGVMDGSLFRSAHSRLLASTFPSTRLVEVAGPDILVAALTRIIEDARPTAARLVRFRDYYWMRMWGRQSGKAGHCEDVLCSVQDFGPSQHSGQRGRNIR